MSLRNTAKADIVLKKFLERQCSLRRFVQCSFV